MNWVAPIKDQETLLQFEKALRETDEKYYILFRIGLGTGLQLQDILKLKVKDVAGKRALKVTIGKKKIVREYILDDDFYQDLSNFVKDRDPKQPLIYGYGPNRGSVSREQVYRVMKQVGDQLGIPNVGAQTIRKTFAWNYYKETGDINYLTELFNHASPTITYQFIGEKPKFNLVMHKRSANENARSRYMLYLNNSGVDRLDAIVNVLNKIRDNFSDSSLPDDYFGIVSQLLDEIELPIEEYKQSASHYRNLLH